jgi:hypothetical protein
MKWLSRPDHAALATIATFTVLRLLLAGAVGLGVDGAYTVSVAHDLELSYYDHPPLQYWIAHLFLPLFGDGRAARVPFIALFAGSCWLLFRLTRRLFDAQAGLLAVVALNCSGYFTLGSGFLVLPDGPLQLALLAAALSLANGLYPEGERTPSQLVTWLKTGFWVGVAGLCKFHALLFAAGVLWFLLSVPRQRARLRHPAPWLGALLALAVASPVIVWNMRHDWISVGYQAGRAALTGVHPAYLLANLAGQALWIFPWIFLPLLIAAWGALRAGAPAERSWYCVCLALPTIVVFTLVPLWGRVGLPHWQMPGWLMLYPVLGEWAFRSIAPLRRRRFGLASAGALLLMIVLFVAEAATGYGRVLAPRIFARGDPTLEVFEWSQLPPELEARGLLRPGTFVITTNWIYAGKIDQALHDAVPVVVFGGNQKQFGLRHDPHSLLGRDAIVVGPVDSLHGVGDALRPHFESIEELAPFALGRSGMSEIPLRLLLARDLKTPLPAPYWRP